MGASKCYSLMKCLLIFLNIVFLCIGIVICSVGIWTGVWGLEGSGAGRLGAGAIGGGGGLLVVASAAGVGGAATHSGGLLAASLILSAMCAAAEGGVAWLVLSHSDTLRVSLREHLRHLIHTQYYSSQHTADIIDAIQHGLSCCGAESLREWESAVGVEGSTGAEGAAGGQGPRGALDLRVSADFPTYRVPPSCCRTEDTAACEGARLVPASPGSQRGVSTELHSRACGPLVLAYLAPPARVCMIVGAGLLGCHALALVLTLALLLHPAPRHLYKA